MGRSRRRSRGWRLAMVVGLLLALVALPAGATPDPEQQRRDAEREAEEEAREAEEAAREQAEAAVADARAQLRSAERRLSAARDATLDARRAGRAADGTVRRAEEEIVPAILTHREAEERLAEARSLVRALRRELRATEVELEEARERLVDRVVHAYKQGTIAADTALPLIAIREAGSPGELAATLKDLEALALAGISGVDELTQRLARLEAELVAALAARAGAEADLDEAEGRIEVEEDTTAEQRRAAEDAEARLLAAIDRELDATAARDDARVALDRAEAALAELEDEPASRSDRDDRDDGDDGEADESDDDPASRLRARQRALDRQRSLEPEQRRTATDWVCPVEGSRFVNDWHFPRTSDRRHEGTDVFAPEGTPIVAVVDGEVVRASRVERGLGGITVSYEHEGQRFYNAHLTAIHEDIEVGGEVRAGDVIGWVGRTGNARGTPPHLHLGWYVDDVAVNPFPSLAVACHEE